LAAEADAFFPLSFLYYTHADISDRTVIRCIKKKLAGQARTKKSYSKFAKLWAAWHFHRA
jgi:hypothetical protein